MSCINLKKKTTVAILCLLSFIGGCILSSQLTTQKIFAREGGSFPQGLEHWGKKVRGQLPRDGKENVTVLRQLEEDASNHHGVYDRHTEATSGTNETVYNEYDYGDNRDLHMEQKQLPVYPAAKPVSKFHYFVEVQDPRAEMIFQKVISKLPATLMKKVVLQNGLGQSRLVRPRMSSRTTQEKWAVFIDSMQDLGYEQRLPTLINIGVKKSGTNAFGFFISQHPQISHSIGNEVHYFDWNYDKGIEYYRSRMGFSTAHQVSFEKTPRYFVTDEAPKNIMKDLPGETKFVICIRDPVERVRSEFRHETELTMRRGKKDRAAVRAKAAKETSTSQGMLLEKTVLEASGQVNASNDIIRTSIYSKHFKNWLETFPRDRFYILSDEQFNKDIYTELKNIERFLGLEPFYRKKMFYYNSDIRAPCMYVKPRPCPAKSTPGFLPKAEPSSEVIQKLRDFYRPYNQEFEKLTQMEFSWTKL